MKQEQCEVSTGNQFFALHSRWEDKLRTYVMQHVI